MSIAARRFKGLARGTTISGITKKQLFETTFVLPPRPEQDRIVAEIEKHLTRLDAATAALKRAQANLKRYRASVLKAACEGRLGPTKEPAKPKTVPVARVIAEPLANGRSPKATATGGQILRLTALRDGRVALNETRKGVIPDGQAERLKIKEQDIFISRGNGSKSLVGAAGLVSVLAPQIEPVCFPDTMIRVRLNPSLCHPEYFVHVWGSRFVRAQIEQAARTTAGIYKISQSDIERIEIPLPSLPEQRIIAAILSKLLDTTKFTQLSLDRIERKGQAMRAAVLNTAFRGQLVPQDPADEPASVLLERIRAARAQEGNQKKKPALRRAAPPKRAFAAKAT